MSQWEKTLVVIKPDGVRRGLVGQVLGRYESKGLAIEALSLRRLDGAFADRHYAEHVQQEWYPPLREFITSGPVVALILAGPAAIEVVRALNGPTNGIAAPPGSIRGDFSSSNRENIVHASDSPESAAREIALWFPEHA
ncbi:nucleoside-diphosphate kinase [Propionicicella superfundia]|uniref:nucleoside-diphosphate kinase n=1 Tax=Propionicicella superfundia TaxID=348582 RepID=UPI000405C5A7|nr:nucleoside-diphosphate kinase [Propionicicella superfundia]